MMNLLCVTAMSFTLTAQTCGDGVVWNATTHAIKVTECAVSTELVGVQRLDATARQVDLAVVDVAEEAQARLLHMGHDMWTDVVQGMLVTTFDGYRLRVLADASDESTVLVLAETNESAEAARARVQTFEDMLDDADVGSLARNLVVIPVPRV